MHFALSMLYVTRKLAKSLTFGLRELCNVIGVFEESRYNFV